VARVQRRPRPAAEVAAALALLAALACSGAPARPAPAAVTSPNCGEQTCDPARSYCFQTGGGAEVEPDAPSPPMTSRCEPFAKSCAADPPDCSCLEPWVSRLADCARDDSGLVKVFEAAP